MKIAHSREEGGQLVREAWISWARTQPDPKPSWLMPWEELEEADKEADRVIWEQVAWPPIKIMQEQRQTIAYLRDELASLEEDMHRYGEWLE